MLRRNKTLSIVMTLCLCLAMLAPVFVAPVAADAAGMYQVLKAPTVKPAAGAQNIDAVVKVIIPDMAIAGGSILTVSMPSDWEFTNNGGVVGVHGANAAAPANVHNPNVVEIWANGNTATGEEMLDVNDFAAASFNITPNKAFDIRLAAAPVSSGADNYFYIYFNGIDLNNSSGDLTVSFVGPSGSIFETASGVVIGKSSRQGDTTTSIKKVKEFAGDDTLDIITIMENSAGTLDNTGTLKFKILTKGFEWDDSAPAVMGRASYGWAFAGIENIDTTIGGNADLSADRRTLEYDINAAFAPVGDAGKVSFINLPVEVDDTVVEAGDEVEIEISGADMTKTTIVAAKYVDFGLTAKEGTAKSIMAGQAEVKVGNFFVQESAAGSWIRNRTITLKLPSGAQWNAVGDIDVNNSSDIGAISDTITGDDNEYLKLTLTGAQSTNKGAEVEFSDYKVDLAPDFEGALEVTVSGNAGVTGVEKIKLADVKPIAKIEVSELKNVELGKPNQAVGTITLVESDVEGFLEDDIRLLLDDGYRFSKVPTVKVTEGDVDISESGVTIDDNELTIPVTGQSGKTAAKIEISDVYIDAFRTAPEGKVYIKFDHGASALNEVSALFPNDYPGSAQVAKCVTPAPVEGTVGSAAGLFKIDSNIYEVNGVAKVMDAAPYIKNGRTYVPVRFLGYALGLTDAEIVWDEAAQKVTFTKGDKVVELTIGSTTYTVSGESKTMDVAPEINNGRTMLPARYVAEGLGYTVGWDPATQTVLVSN
jgi:hypothetical protein